MGMSPSCAAPVPDDDEVADADVAPGRVDDGARRRVHEARRRVVRLVVRVVPRRVLERLEDGVDGDDEAEREERRRRAHLDAEERDDRRVGDVGHALHGADDEEEGVRAVEVRVERVPQEQGQEREHRVLGRPHEVARERVALAVRRRDAHEPELAGLGARPRGGVAAARLAAPVGEGLGRGHERRVRRRAGAPADAGADGAAQGRHEGRHRARRLGNGARRRRRGERRRRQPLTPAGRAWRIRPYV